MARKKFFIAPLLLQTCLANASAIIDEDVADALQKKSSKSFISLLAFSKSIDKADAFASKMLLVPSISVERLQFMPATVVTFAAGQLSLNDLKKFAEIDYIALNKQSGEKVELSSEELKPKVSFRYPGLELWWNNGYKGQSGVVGIIDSGIASDHPSLKNKQIITNQGAASQFARFKSGVRSAHGTGVACIYAGYPADKQNRFRGVAYKVPIILSTLAGDSAKEKDDYNLTYMGLNWLLNIKDTPPSVINYSFGNGEVACKHCADWSGMAKIVDYIINKKRILWVTSAGNNGYVKPAKKAPYSSSLTVPADGYNGLTVANMNMYAEDEFTMVRKYMRATHAIRYTSSRGPTLAGRKKPDISAPGNDTYTCAPPPEKYDLKYTPEMNYANGYRLMGGTSSAAPHVGGAVLLLREAGIKNPMAIKALLINSAETWTDGGVPGPDDPDYDYKGGHHQQLGAEWNPTYGWGYLNMETAYHQRHNIIENFVSAEKPSYERKMRVRNKDKITLVHERRVGFNSEGDLWGLTHLKLQLLDAKTRKVLVEDNSLIDNVHQISLCNPNRAKRCLDKKLKSVILKVSLVSAIDGQNQEDFALAFSTVS